MKIISPHYITKTEYALSLCPHLSANYARTRLYEIIVSNRQLMRRMMDAGWRPHDKWLSLRMVEILDEFLNNKKKE